MLNDTINMKRPLVLEKIFDSTKEIGFNAICEDKIGSILRTLASSKPKSKFLEIGTGTGVSTAWILEGMDNESNLISVERDDSVLSVAKTHLGNDKRVQFIKKDAKEFIKENSDKKFDFVLADCWTGKYSLLDETLNMINVGGFYIIDDLLPQDNWPMDDYPLKVRNLIYELEGRQDIVITKLNWGSGLIIGVKV